MASTDFHSNVNPFLAFSEEQMGAGITITSANIDTQGFEGVEFLVHTKIVVSTLINADAIMKTQESDDNSIFTDTSTGFQIGTGFPSDGSTIIGETIVYRIGYVGKKRYVRLVLIGPTGTNDFSVTAFLAATDPSTAPVPSV